MSFERTAELSGTVFEISFEHCAVQFGEVGHEREGPVALQPAQFGIQRAIAAAVTRGQPAPVRPPQCYRVFRGNMFAGKANIEHLANESDLIFGQRRDHGQRIGGIVLMTGGLDDLRQLLLLRKRIMPGKELREPPGQPEGDRETQDDDGGCNESGMGDAHGVGNDASVSRKSK
jgi:hypothetical protein